MTIRFATMTGEIKEIREIREMGITMDDDDTLRYDDGR